MTFLLYEMCRVSVVELVKVTPGTDTRSRMFQAFRGQNTQFEQKRSTSTCLNYTFCTTYLYNTHFIVILHSHIKESFLLFSKYNSKYIKTIYKSSRMEDEPRKLIPLRVTFVALSSHWELTP